MRRGGILAGVQPQAILLGTFILTLAIACLTTLPACAAALTIAAATVFLAANPGRPFFSQLLKANFFILFIWLFTPFAMRGEPLLELWHFTISREGVLLCLLITIKANAILLLFLGLVAPMSIYSLGRALSALKCPDKLAWLFILMERNVDILKNEWSKLGTAAKLRGFAPKTGLRAYKTYAAMAGLLLMRAYDRGQAMREALLLSGYDGALPFRPRRPGYCDFIFLAASAVLSAALFVLNHTSC